MWYISHSPHKTSQQQSLDVFTNTMAINEPVYKFTILPYLINPNDNARMQDYN